MRVARAVGRTPLELLAEPLLDSFGHRVAEHRHDGVGRERTKTFDGTAHLGPLLLRLARARERAPDLLDEELDEHP